MDAMQVTSALREMMPEIMKTREHFGEDVQVNKLLEEIEELRPHLNRYKAMISGGYSPELEFSLTADEMADVLIVMMGLIAANEALDNAVADRIYFKTHRTITRIENGYYGADGRAALHAEDQFSVDKAVFPLV